MAVGILEGFNAGKRRYLNARTGNPVRLANLAFGHGTDVPDVSGVSRGGIYSYDGLEALGDAAQVIQVTRDNSVNRGHYDGAIRVGFYKQDIEPPETATSDALKGCGGVLFCYAQEVNDHPIGFAEATKPAPDPTGGFADKVEGTFNLIFSVNYSTSGIGMQLRCESRLPSFGGGILHQGSDDTRTLSAGDFIGIELRWEASEAPDSIGGDGHPKPTILLKGYTATTTDFSDKLLVTAAQHNFDHPPVSEQSAWFKGQITKWNIWGVQRVIRDPLLEGASVSTGNLHGFVWSYYEVFDGT